MSSLQQDVKISSVDLPEVIRLLKCFSYNPFAIIELRKAITHQVLAQLRAEPEHDAFGLRTGSERKLLPTLHHSVAELS